MPAIVHTVLGPVPADELGVVAVHEALVSVLPGAEYGYDLVMDRAEIFETLVARLVDFRQCGGGTIVDSTGMFHGRDVRLLEALSRTTGVHVVASTGQGPEGVLGGYFLTPQTNPPTPWPADKFADLFSREVTQGMVVPRVERRGAAGLVATAATVGGMTATDESLLRGAARAGLATGVPVSFGVGADAVAEIEVAFAEGLPADRLLVADAGDQAAKVADLGAYVVLTDPALVVSLVEAGHAERVLLATGGAALSFGHDVPRAAYAPLATALPDDIAHQVLVANPRDLLTVKER